VVVGVVVLLLRLVLLLLPCLPPWPFIQHSSPLRLLVATLLPLSLLQVSQSYMTLECFWPAGTCSVAAHSCGLDSTP
jgi:hypothetical protein